MPLQHNQSVTEGAIDIQKMTADNHPAYRADVDGLRAIAVLSVLAFHAFPSVLSGGFVGVDIFFVISGYLISGIIFKNLEQDRFSYGDFYARRIKRIFPTLIVVLSLCLVAGWFFFYAMEFQDLGWHVFAGSAFYSNISLLLYSGGYFDGAAEYTPLLHLWSLGVEEQFYIFWPIIAGLIWHRGRHALMVIVIIALCSFILNVSMVGPYPSATFYLPFTRIWELLAGSLIAYLNLFRGDALHFGVRLLSKKELDSNALARIANLLSWAGLTLIIIALAVLDKQHAFPGWWAILPVTGSALLITAGPDTWIARHLLANRFMVFVGLISYPLYLWHWPLLVFARILVPDGPAPWLTATLMATSILLAWISYRFIEGNLRYRSSNGPTPKILFALLTVIALLGLFFNKVPVQMRLENSRTEPILDAMGDWEYPGGDNFRKKEDFTISVLNEHNAPVVVLIGDSHIEQYWNRFHRVVDESDKTKLPELWFATYGSCPPLPHANIVDPGFACDKFLEFALEKARDKRVKSVVFGAWWEIYFGKAYGLPPNPPLLYDARTESKTGIAIHTKAADEMLQAFTQQIHELRKHGKTVYIVLSNPSASAYDPRRMVDRLSGKIIYPGPVPLKNFVEATRVVTDKLRAAALAGGAIILDPAASLCHQGVCDTANSDGDPLYKDSNHLRPFYAAEDALFIDRVMTGK